MCVYHGWIGWIEVCSILSSNMILSSHLRGGSENHGWNGWISNNLQIRHFLGPEFSSSMRVYILVELVESRFNSSLLLIRCYLAILDGMAKILVELVELVSYHSRNVRCLIFLLVGLPRSLLNWLNWGIILAFIMTQSTHLWGCRANHGWIGWISSRSLHDGKLLEISCSRCTLIMVELVESATYI